MVMYLFIMSVSSDEPRAESDFGAAERALAHFRAQELASGASMGLGEGMVIRTITVRPGVKSGILSLAVGVDNAATPDSIMGAAGLRIIHADREMAQIKVIDITRSPGGGTRGHATVAHLYRHEDELREAARTGFEFTADRPLQLVLERGEFAKYMFWLEAGEMPVSSLVGDEPIELDEASELEFRLARDVHEVLGWVNIESIR